MSDEDLTTPLGVALALASRGYDVFPAKVTHDSAGKKIVTPTVKWSMASTTLPGMIREWWKQWPSAYPCIDTGKSGVVAVDCDVRHGDGPGTWQAMADPGAVLHTTSGGEHHLYRADPEHPVRNDQAGALAESVDVRGEGGMIIVHPAGAPDVATLPPAGLLPPTPTVIPASLRSARTVEPEAPEDLFDVAPREERRFTADQAMDRIIHPALMDLQRVAQANQGGVNGSLNSAAVTLSHFVPQFFSADQAMAWLERALGPVPDGGTPQPLERFRRIVDGREPVRDGWTAVLREPDPLPASSSEVVDDAVEVEYQRLKARRAAIRRLDAEEGAAIASQDAIAALRSELLTSRELDSIEDLEPLIDQWLYKDSLARIIGASGSGKTFVALDMALTVASKRQWFGYDTRGGPVVYVVAEGARGVRKRVRAWEREKNSGLPVDDLYILPRAVQILDEDYLALVDVVRDLGAVMVILDTQARVTVGIDENSATDMGRVVAQADRMRADTGASVVLIHHTGHAGTHARGSTAVYGAEQTEIEVVRGEGMQITLRTTKQKDHDESEGSWRLSAAHDSLVMTNLDGEDRRESPDARVASSLLDTVAEGMGLREQIARVLHEHANGISAGVTYSELRSAMNDARERADLPVFARTPKRGQCAEGGLRSALVRMQRDAGHVERPGVRYRLSASGCEHYGLTYRAPGEVEENDSE